MDELETKGLIIQETRRDFARNTLVLIVPINAQPHRRSFNDLSNPKLKRLAIGNPKTVPAGQYTQQLLKNMNVWATLQPRLILAEDVRQVLDYVVREEVEAGIVYASDVVIARRKVSVAAHAPEGSHDPILYPIAVVKESRQPEVARQFIETVLDSEGQGILRKYGFLSAR